MSDWKQSASVRRDFRASATEDVAGPKATGRKDTKRWCKGRVGREHTYERRPFDRAGCSLGSVEVCVICGKERGWVFPPIATILRRNIADA